MSDSASAPAPAAAPAAPAGAADRGPVIGPPPSSQPALSVSEAGRLLSSQRRQAAAAGAAPGAPAKETPAPAAQPAIKPSPNEMVAKPLPAAEGEKPAAAAAAPKAATGVDAMARALGVPDAAAPAEPGEPGIIEIEGQKLRTLDEVREFARRKSADYTQKTMALAEQQRQVQAQQQALATVLPYIQPELQKLAQSVQQPVNKPDINLLQTNPAQYFQELHNYEVTRAEIERLAGINNIQSEAQQRAAAAQVAAGNEVLAREFPSLWADPQQRLETQQQIVEWATSKGGFSRDELRNVTDPRAIKMMMKAAQLDRLVEGAKTTAPQQATTVPRGAPPPPPPTERVSVATERFEQRPSIRTGAQLLSARRANGAAPR